MAATIEDFIKRFGGGGTLDDREAQQYHDRFVSTHEDDRAFDNQAYHEGATEYLEKLPDDQFHQAARNAVAQVPAQQRQDLLGGLLNALGGGAAGGTAGQAGGGGMGEGLGNIAKMLGLGSADPRNMSEEDAVKVMDYARKENPEALRQTVQEKPWFVKALGNPVVMGALTLAAAKLLSNQRK